MTTVLIIDDDPGMRDMIRRMLESASLRVLEAPSGVTGVPLFREQRPDIVITDVLMPDKDGVETLRDIKKLDPQARIIAISGGGRAKYKNFLNIAREFGASETLEKPFRREELLQAVAKLLK